LEKVKAEMAAVSAIVKASRVPEPTLVATVRPGPVVVPTQGPTSRERVVVIGLGEAAAALREKPLTIIKELAQKDSQFAKLAIYHVSYHRISQFRRIGQFS
jgi:hypothetical protein